MSSEQLAACPFCGGTTCFAGSTLDDSWYVTCGEDACSGMVGYFRTRDEAIAAWSTRVIAPTRDGEVGRLRKWLKHDRLCGIVGGYGYCTCGLDAALATQAEGVDRG